MIRRASIGMLLVLLLASFACSGISHGVVMRSIPLVGDATNSNEMGTSHLPADLQMDRDIGDLPGTQLSAPLAAAPVRLLIAVFVPTLSVRWANIPGDKTDIVQKQHVFRI